MKCYACCRPLKKGERYRVVPVFGYARFQDPPGEPEITNWCIKCSDAEGLVPLSPGEKKRTIWLKDVKEGYRKPIKRFWNFLLGPR